MNILYGIFIGLHGLVHFWYVTLSQGWVEFEPDMGWTGQSWLLSGLFKQGAVNSIASAAYSTAAVLLVAAGLGLLAKTDWASSLLLASAIVSAIVILAFWDGSMSLIVQKGGLGLLINLAVIGAVTLLR